MATTDLEEQYRIVAGTIAAAAAHLAWLAGGLAACASVLQCPESVGDAIRLVAQRLPQGLTANAAQLAHLQVPGLSRYYLNRLATEGYETVKSLKTASPETLRVVLPGFLVERVLEASVPRFASDERVNVSTGDCAPDSACTPAPVQSYGSAEAPETGSETADLEIDTQRICEAFERESPQFDLVLDSADPGAVQFHGKPLRLPPKPYALLILLAQRCGRTVPYTSIDEIVWPGEKVEPQQISAHKSRLIRELANITTRDIAEAVIVTDARYGLRLNLERHKVRLIP